jgi:hypothetical protein
MSLPLFFIHRANSYYLRFSLQQARITNPGSSLNLIGDTTNDRYPQVRHSLIRDYSASAEHFAKIYRHMSLNSYEFELFCFQRWFILDEFVTRHNVEGNFMYLDSDVLLYRDLTSLLPWLNQYRLTLTEKRGPEYLFFKCPEVLHDFCSFIREQYQNPKHLTRLQEFFLDYIKDHRRGGVCDMTLLELFAGQHPGQAVDLAHVHEDTIFDDNFSVSNGFLMDGAVKKIVWQGDEPYGLMGGGRRRIRFNAIHFQGAAKGVMHRYYTGTGLRSARIALEGIHYLRLAKHRFRAAMASRSA